MALLKGIILSPQGLQAGSLVFDGHILELSATASSKAAPYILPGFIDVHVHGGGGADTMDGAEGVKTLAKFHLQHGTTSLYPTTITNPWQSILKALEGVKQVMLEEPKNLPSILGVHLEGPFISPNRLGAQPPNAIEPSQELIQEALEFDVIKLVTLAPEIPNALAAAKQFSKAGVQLSVGHTRASYEEVLALSVLLKQMGARLGFTHLYNAMGGLEGRKPAVVGAALADADSFAELIFDRQHVHEASFLSAFNAKPDKLLFITDAMRASGMKDGKSELGGQEVSIKDGKAQLSDGTLAGSLLTLDQALGNAVNAGLSLEQASHLVSRNPANYMQLNDRGTLELGKRADMVVLDKELRILEVYVAGKKRVG